VKFARSFFLLPLLISMAVLAAVPSVPVRDVAGNPRNVNEFIGKGKWAVVVVWSADCPICKRDIHQMTFFHDEHRRKDAEVLGISIDGFANRDKVRRFVEDHALNFPNVIGTPDDASMLAGTMFIGTPTVYVFAPDGRFVSQRIGATSQEQVEAMIDAARAKHSG